MRTARSCLKLRPSRHVLTRIVFTKMIRISPSSHLHLKAWSTVKTICCKRITIYPTKPLRTRLTHTLLSQMTIMGASLVFKSLLIWCPRPVSSQHRTKNMSIRKLRAMTLMMLMMIAISWGQETLQRSLKPHINRDRNLISSHLGLTIWPKWVPLIICRRVKISVMLLCRLRNRPR